MAKTKQWTEGRLKTFITSNLRSAFRKYPLKSETLNDAFVDKRINRKTKRMSKHYRCKSCSGIFPTSEVQVDHIDPVVSLEEGFQGWDVYVKRLFCGREGLQVLCTTCHDAKSKRENELRRESTKKNG